MVSYETEFSIFFRSSLRDHFHGLHCEYEIIPELLSSSTNAPSTTTTSASTTSKAEDDDSNEMDKDYNGDGM